VNVEEDSIIADSYAAECYGLDPDGAAGAPIDDFVAAVHEDDIERVLREFERAITETGSLETEYRVRNGDGDLVWLLSRGTVEYDDAGTPRKLHGAISDISEQKRRERRDQFLLELSDRLRALESEEAIGESCTELLAAELGLDRAYFVRFFPDRAESLVGPEYHEPDLDPVSGLYPFSSFPEAIRQIQSGSLVFDDTANAEALPETERQALLDLGFGAWVGAPIRTDDETADWALYAVTSEPHDWTDAEVSLIEEAADRTWTAVERARAQEILNESNQSLERLNDVSQALIDADPETIRGRVAELTVDVLGVEYAALWRYDGRTGDLKRDSEHAASGTDLDAIRPSDVSREDVWDTFVDDEINVEGALDVAEGEWPSRLGSRVFVPLGRNGVVVAGSVDSETFDDRMVDLVSMVGQTVETLWDRAESERELERRNEELTRLDRLNALIRGIDQALVAAGTREEIDEAVCERLADSALYEFAWIGRYDAETETVAPRAWAGVDSAYLDALRAEQSDAVTDGSPFTAAIRTGELQVVADVATDARATPWREETLERGGRSCLCIPLAYDESVYGVLTVYGDAPQQEIRDTEVLVELGRTIAHAISAIETRDSVRTDTVYELTLESTAAETPLCRLSRTTGCAIDFEGQVTGSDGHTTTFFTASGADPDAVETACERSVAVEDLVRLDDRDDGVFYKARLADSTFAGVLLDEGATVRSLAIDAGTVTAVVELPDTADVSTVLTAIRRSVPDVELLARQTRTRSPDAELTLQTSFEERLTPRQQEVLQLAYRSGFFQSPRLQTGRELADALDLSQSTFNYHLRGAERTLFELVFDSF